MLGAIWRTAKIGGLAHLLRVEHSLTFKTHVFGFKNRDLRVEVGDLRKAYAGASVVLQTNGHRSETRRSENRPSKNRWTTTRQEKKLRNSCVEEAEPVPLMTKQGQKFSYMFLSERARCTASERIDHDRFT